MKILTLLLAVSLLSAFAPAAQADEHETLFRRDAKTGKFVKVSDTGGDETSVKEIIADDKRDIELRRRAVRLQRIYDQHSLADQGKLSTNEAGEKILYNFKVHDLKELMGYNRHPQIGVFQGSEFCHHNTITQADFEECMNTMLPPTSLAAGEKFKKRAPATGEPASDKASINDHGALNSREIK